MGYGWISVTIGKNSRVKDMKTTNNFSKIRFIGYAIPTTPANLVSIGDPDGPGAVAGTYLGSSDIQTDFRERIQILKNGVDTAKQKLLTDEEGVINLFVAPEFYFHGIQGPYIYKDANADPVNLIKQALADTFNVEEYPNWTFVFGSVITSQIQNQDKVFNSNATITRNKVVQALAAQWVDAYGPLKGVIFDMLVNFIKVCHSYPCCEVRNRSIIVSNIPIRPPEHGDGTTVMTTEKYFVSNEDFVLYDPDGKPVITEQMTAYPSLDLSAGDAKQTAFDEFAIFRQDGLDPNNRIKTSVMDYGIEICLDHSDTRLRRNIKNEPKIIGGVHVQIIPSCGMQINAPNVAADKDGFVFNCDGQYALYALNDEVQGHAVMNDVDCLYANYTYTDPQDAKYASHTQLARVDKPADGGDPIKDAHATFQTLPDDDITVIDVNPPSNLNSYFAGGAGQIHIYGLDKPYTLYP